MNTRTGLLSLVLVGIAVAATPPLVADEPANWKSTENVGLSPDEALKRLKEGNARFAADRPQEAEISSKKRIELSQGQRPIAVILTCSDSRAAPEIVFDKGLGVLFVVRVAGNVGGPEVYASIEYALAELKTSLIVVLGHKNCGAVDATLKGKEQPSENLKHLVDLIHTGGKLPKDKHAALDAAIRSNVLYQAQLLTSRSVTFKLSMPGRKRSSAGSTALSKPLSLESSPGKVPHHIRIPYGEEMSSSVKALGNGDLRLEKCGGFVPGSGSRRPFSCIKINHDTRSV